MATILSQPQFVKSSNAVTVAVYRSDFEPSKDTPYLALRGELWGVYREYFGRKFDFFITALHCTSFPGWEQPAWFALPGDDAGYKPSYRRTNWFKPVGRECDLVMNKVGLIDLTPFGKIEVKGKDAHEFMDRICANAIPKVRNVICGTGKMRHNSSASQHPFSSDLSRQKFEITHTCRIVLGKHKFIHLLSFLEMGEKQIVEILPYGCKDFFIVYIQYHGY